MAFASDATNLDPADTDAPADVYVKDLLTGDLTLASTTCDGGVNILEGFGGGDTLYGLDGDATLIGGQGRDTFFGGVGTDTCDDVVGEAATSCEI